MNRKFTCIVCPNGCEIEVEYEGKDVKNIEGEDWLKYEWLDISKIDEYPLLPTSIKSVLKENKFPVHKINKDI